LANFPGTTHRDRIDPLERTWTAKPILQKDTGNSQIRKEGYDLEVQIQQLSAISQT
jgi:hypothetical protein